MPVALGPAKPIDTDGDGIPDDRDTCPDDKEDRDGFEDADGCPDPDNDKDLILDVNDKCPNEPETYNGFQDDDGCPDIARVSVGPETTPKEELRGLGGLLKRVLIDAARSRRRSRLPPCTSSRRSSCTSRDLRWSRARTGVVSPCSCTRRARRPFRSRCSGTLRQPRVRHLGWLHLIDSLPAAKEARQAE
ncbi:MAG: OmpA domain protein [Myxococcales bacterium]|nr:OmpA domain protein [Myxococcales bacterium]